MASISQTKPVDCAICTETLQPTESKILTTCKHLFHENCIGQWLQINNSCPNCRKDDPLPEGNPLKERISKAAAEDAEMEDYHLFMSIARETVSSDQDLDRLFEES